HQCGFALDENGEGLGVGGGDCWYPASAWWHRLVSCAFHRGGGGATETTVAVGVQSCGRLGAGTTVGQGVAGNIFRQSSPGGAGEPGGIESIGVLFQYV